MANSTISGIDPKTLHSLNPSPIQAASQENKGKGFVDTLVDAVKTVEKKEADANRAVQDLAVGNRRTLHETMIKMEQSEIAFKMMMAVRTKVLNAYQEVMRMHF
ncbi:flagellar hook-basal body complex protein FliE [Dethiosulfatarculus sandiegensis]|uniref:Flagellar hook-basal body complex protein FliE n=1 Tax=Dethiosulfatarculus sandiegensis TaxID=1429043 RepID=A0A0D2JCF5_9BACT|nr:flagellar hook-basal body complex protein FliE [Dethiosulfatarculus sandiegensis]KIX15824.1 flagellar basal body protein FliE [Dethiosulfatarculus sandiegensis]